MRSQKLTYLLLAMLIGVVVLQIAWIRSQTYIELQNIVPLAVWKHGDENYVVIFGEDVSTGNDYVFLYDYINQQVLHQMQVQSITRYQIDYDPWNNLLLVFNPSTTEVEFYIVDPSQGFVLNHSVSVSYAPEYLVAVGTFTRFVIAADAKYVELYSYNGTNIARSPSLCFGPLSFHGVDYGRGNVLVTCNPSDQNNLRVVKVAEGVVEEYTVSDIQLNRYVAAVVDTEQGLWIAVAKNGSSLLMYKDTDLAHPTEVSLGINYSITYVSRHSFLETSGVMYFAAQNASGVMVIRVEYSGTTVDSVSVFYFVEGKSYPDLATDPSGQLLLFYYDPYAARPGYELAAQIATVTRTVTQTQTFTETKTVVENVTTTVTTTIPRTVTEYRTFIKYYTITVPATEVTVTEYVVPNRSPITIASLITNTTTTVYETTVTETVTTTVEGTVTTYTTVVPRTVTETVTVVYPDGVTTITSPWYIVATVMTTTSYVTTYVTNETITVTETVTEETPVAVTIGDNYAIAAPVLVYATPTTVIVPYYETETVTVTTTVIKGIGIDIENILIIVAVIVALGISAYVLAKRM